MQASSWLPALLVAAHLANLVNAASPVVVAEPPAAERPQQPQLAVDRKGTIHVAFGTTSGVHYVRSEDQGKSFSKPIRLDTTGVISLGMRRGPRIAISGDAVCLSLIGGQQGKGRDGDVRLFRSQDKGLNWDEPVVVNDEPAAAREGLHAMAAAPNGSLTCVWLDLRNNSTEIFASSSEDGGKTWSKNVRVYRSPSGSVCECCHPNVTYAPDGKLHVMWRNSLSGNRDMYCAVSIDGGKTFGAAKKLGAGVWSLDRCPMDGGSLAVLTNGKLATAWRRDNTVYLFAEGASKETELGQGEQPWMTASNKGPVVVWLKKRGDVLLIRYPGSSKPIELAKTATDPVVVSGGPKNDLVVAAWEEGSGSGRKILCQRIELGR
jgi:hypothetical protein